MKMNLEYSTSAGGPWTKYGVINPAEGHNYTVSPISSIDRAGGSLNGGFRVTVQSRAITIPPSFLDNDQYFWRIDFESLSIISLGERPYIFSFSGEVTRNKLFFYDISIDFHVPSSDLLSYVHDLYVFP